MKWSIHNPDGTRSGPFDTQQLVKALQAGAISGQAWVQRLGDTGWRPLASFEAFGDFCDPEEPIEVEPKVANLRLALACGSVLFAFLVGWML